MGSHLAHHPVVALVSLCVEQVSLWHREFWTLLQVSRDRRILLDILFKVFEFFGPRCPVSLELDRPLVFVVDVVQTEMLIDIVGLGLRKLRQHPVILRMVGTIVHDKL